MKKIFFSSIFVLFCSSFLTAQEFIINAEMRPRFENRHGFKTLINLEEEGASFISQRSRIGLDFHKEKLSLGISLQNIRVWGDVYTMATDDKAFAFHQAWANYQFSEKFSLKIGIQEILYDDSRIFGNVDWAQQARSFDAIVAKFKFHKNGILDIGYSLNNDSEQLINSLYSNIAGYKTFQYAWYHNNFQYYGFSLLSLNNGVEYLNSDDQEELSYSQTIGGRVTFKKTKVAFDSAIYFQTGNLLASTVSAHYFGGNLFYQISDNYNIGIGTEYLSGKDMNDASNTVKSFNPLYGTNHKFNGLMDYFYVGNHLNSVGLLDLNTPIAYSKNKFSAKITPHFFSSAAAIYEANSKQDDYLGTEIDLVLGYHLSKEIFIDGGFSKMYGTHSLEILKGGDRNENNSWAWLMVTFKPTLFASK